MHGSPAGGLPVKRVRFAFKYIDWGNAGNQEYTFSRSCEVITIH